MKITFIALLLPLIAGCGTVLPPVISDIRESMVKVEAYKPTIFDDWPTWIEIKTEAQRGCSQYNRLASPISHRCTTAEQTEHCFTNANGYTHCTTTQGECQVKEYLFACK